MARSDKKQPRLSLARAGGLLTVAVIGLMVAACGLTMAFGLYRISKLIFLATLAALVVVQLIARRK